jgi:hypothetical protein
MWDIFLLVVVIGSRDLSAMYATCHSQNIVAIFDSLASRFETVSIGNLLEEQLTDALSLSRSLARSFSFRLTNATDVKPGSPRP